MHTTNYANTFIKVAEDYALDVAKTEIKPDTIGALQLAILTAKPYEITSDDLLFEVFTIRNNIAQSESANKRAAFFSKPQACLRASPLVKTLGYGIHHNEQSKIAAFAIESEQYCALLQGENIKKVAGMRSKRA